MLDRRQSLKAAVALAGLAVSGGRGWAAASPAIISLSEQRSRFLAAVELNGATGYRFVVDTGATAHFISQRLVEALSLPKLEERFVRGHDGRKRDSVVGISRLTVGGVDLGRAEAIAWAPERLEEHDGLIGYPFLYPRAVIALGEGRISLGETAAGPLTPVRAQVMRNQTLMIGGVPGAEGRFVFDTGSQSCTISPAYHKRIADTEAYKAAVKLVYRDKAGANHTLAFRAKELAFGAFRVPEAIVRIGADDDRVGVFAGIDGLFGVNLLRPYTWAIDQAGGSLSAGGEHPTRLGWFGSGFRIEAGGGLARISAVQDGGPAFEAGVRPGQQVLSLGGEPPERWTPAFLRAMTPTDRTSLQVVELIDRGARRTAAFATKELL